jgi:hypothetical protein
MDYSTGKSEINDGLRAMLCQTDKKGDERVIAYSSRKLLNH